MATDRKLTTVQEGEDGIWRFSLAQTEIRFAMCWEALSAPRLNPRLLKCYQQDQEIAEHSRFDFSTPEEFDVIYSRILLHNSWGGRTHGYLKTKAVEGGFYPFIRYRGSNGKVIADTGCIWIGNRLCHPRIYADNRLAWWDEPVFVTGEVMQRPFLPFPELSPYIRELSDGRYSRKYRLNRVDPVGLPGV